MNKELTPMQELIEIFTTMSKQDGDGGFVGRSALSIIKNSEFLPKEKQVNEQFYEKGFELGNDVSFEDYYNNKFKNY